MGDRDIYEFVMRQARSGQFRMVKHEMHIVCPGCGDEDHFSVNVFNGLYNCFKCQTAGSIRRLMLLDVDKWKKAVVGHLGTPVIVPKTPFSLCPLNARPVEDIVGEGCDYANTEKTALYHQALNVMEYCLGRGMTRKQIVEYKVAIIPFDNRVYFPFWDEDGKVVYWMGRATSDVVEPKTIDTQESSKPLFGRHVKKCDDNVVLVEGVFDHFVTAGSYALMGSSVTEDQIHVLKMDGVKRVFVLMDNDAGAQSEANAIKLAGAGLLAYEIILDTGKSGHVDPAELGRSKMSEIVKCFTTNLPPRMNKLYYHV